MDRYSFFNSNASFGTVGFSSQSRYDSSMVILTLPSWVNSMVRLRGKPVFSSSQSLQFMTAPVGVSDSNVMTTSPFSWAIVLNFPGFSSAGSRGLGSSRELVPDTRLARVRQPIRMERSPFGVATVTPLVSPARSVLRASDLPSLTQVIFEETPSPVSPVTVSRMRFPSSTRMDPFMSRGPLRVLDLDSTLNFSALAWRSFCSSASKSFWALSWARPVAAAKPTTMRKSQRMSVSLQCCRLSQCQDARAQPIPYDTLGQVRVLAGQSPRPVLTNT